MRPKKALHFATILLAVFLFTGCASQHKTKPADPMTSEKNIREVLTAYVDGRQARDIPAVVATLDPEVDQLTSRGEWRRGVDAATAGMKRSSAQNPGDRILKIETVRFLSDDVALADARYTIKGTDGKPDRVLWSSFTLVQYFNGHWKITSIRNQKPAE